MDFKVGARGWAYVCESHGLVTKGDFDLVEKLINDCRKSGLLPLDICLVDESRAFDHVQEIDDATPEQQAKAVMAYVANAHLSYTPTAFWENQEYYVQMVVEKSTLKGMFTLVCAEFNVPLATASGWSDLHMRADMMGRFEEWETEGKQCVLLYCGDHDPGGLQISDFLRKNMEDMEGAVGWRPDDLIIERFGLNYDFIMEHGLTWIENLITSAGKDLGDPNHKDFNGDYVQSYIRQFGKRKVEAEALVKVPEAGRDLCRQAILKYINLDAADEYQSEVEQAREDMHEEVMRLLAEGRDA